VVQKPQVQAPRQKEISEKKLKIQGKQGKKADKGGERGDVKPPVSVSHLRPVGKLCSLIFGKKCVRGGGARENLGGRTRVGLKAREKGGLPWGEREIR